MRRALMLGLLVVQGWAGACFYPNTEDVYLSRFITQQDMKETPCRPESSSDTASTKRKVTCYESSKSVDSTRNYVINTLYSIGVYTKDNVSEDGHTFYLRHFGLTISVFPDNLGSFVRVENLDSAYEYLIGAFETPESTPWGECPKTDKAIVSLAYCYRDGNSSRLIFSPSFSIDNSLKVGQKYTRDSNTFCISRFLPVKE